jgi:hypothetical protein
MNRVVSAAAASVTLAAAVACATIVAAQNKKEIVALTPDEVRWFTPLSTTMADSERSCSATRRAYPDAKSVSLKRRQPRRRTAVTLKAL